MTAEAILTWHDFFVTIAQVGATLAGLLFVGLTISLPHVLGVSGYLSRAFAALFLQFEMLVIGLWGLLPSQSGFALGVEYVCTGVAFATGITVFAWNFPEDGTTVLGGRGARLVRTTLGFAGTWLPVVAGIGLIAGRDWALFLLMPTAISCLYLSIGNAWVFAVEIPRRMNQSRSNGPVT